MWPFKRKPAPEPRVFYRPYKPMHKCPEGHYSGEATICCPKCGSRRLVNVVAREKCIDHAYGYTDILDRGLFVDSLGYEEAVESA